MAELVSAVGLAESKSETRRLVAQGGISVDGQHAMVNDAIKPGGGMVIQRGQRRDARAVRLYLPK